MAESAVVVATSMWDVFSEFVTPCNYFTVGPVNQGTMQCLIRPVRPALVAGTLVAVTDSEVLIQASQMGAVTHPVATDYLLTLDSLKRWDVITGQLKASKAMMWLIVRRVY